MRISDWSSDVCSSDLVPQQPALEDLGAEQVVRTHAQQVDAEEPDHQRKRQHTAADIGLWHHVVQHEQRDPAEGEGQQQAQQEVDAVLAHVRLVRSEEHTSELQSLMRISYAVFCLKKKTTMTSNRQ